MMYHHQRLSVWAFDQSTQWWDIMVPSFTESPWVQNICMLMDTLVL